MPSRPGVRSSNGPRARPVAADTDLRSRPDRRAPQAPSPADELDRARDLGIDTCGRIAEFWGFTRTMGRAFGLLYLAPEPLTQMEIQKRLQISAGSASMTLAGLIRWGVVHKVWVPGQRREHYRAETDFWKMISGVLNERERREISAAIDLVTEAEVRVKAAKAAAAKAATPTATKQGTRTGAATPLADVDFTANRLARLHEICSLGAVMLDMLLGHMKLDVGRFRDVLKD